MGWNDHLYPYGDRKERDMETEQKHTKGPWRNDDGTIYRDGAHERQHIATVHPGAMRVTISREAEDRANARLIASAPALLEENAALLEALRAVVEEFERPHDHSRNLPSVMRAARSALALAEGRRP